MRIGFFFGRNIILLSYSMRHLSGLLHITSTNCFSNPCMLFSFYALQRSVAGNRPPISTLSSGKENFREIQAYVLETETQDNRAVTCFNGRHNRDVLQEILQKSISQMLYQRLDQELYQAVALKPCTTFPIPATFVHMDRVDRDLLPTQQCLGRKSSKRIEDGGIRRKVVPLECTRYRRRKSHKQRILRVPSTKSSRRYASKNSGY